MEAHGEQLSEALEHQGVTARLLELLSRAPSDTHSVVETVCEHVASAASAPLVQTYLVDRGGLGWEAASRVFLETGRTPGPANIQIDDTTALGAAALTGSVVHVPDIESPEGRRYPQSQRIADRNQWRTTVALPFRRGDQLLGVIEANRAMPRQFTPRELRLLQVIADGASLAVHAAQVSAELRERLEEQEALANSLRAIASAPAALRPTLRTVAEEVARAFAADDVQIGRIADDQLVLEAAWGMSEGREIGSSYSLDRGSPAGRAARTGELIHTPNAREDPHSAAKYVAFVTRVGVGSSLAVPLRRGGATLGSLLVRRRLQVPFSERQIRLLQAFADQVVVAMEDAGLYRELEIEREKSDRLLLNILPAPIASRLKEHEGTIADSYPDVTVFFADVVGFTELSAAMSPESLVQRLDTVFRTFDDLIVRHGLEKIKTIGDAYMVAGGLPIPRVDHVEAVADFALDVRRSFDTSSDGLRVRIGMNAGPVVAGVIGSTKFAYDLWGDTVNTAARMESHGLPSQIQCSLSIYDRLKDRYVFEPRGEIPVRGKGSMHTFLLVGRR